MPDVSANRTGFDKAGIEAFVSLGEKSAPPVFVGRKNVFESIVMGIRQAWSSATGFQGEPGMTRILQGAPGAGKSSILHELRQRAMHAARKPAGNGVPTPRILVLNSGNIHGPEDILGPLSGIMLPGRDFGQETRERVRMAASQLFGLELDGAESRKPDPDMQKWTVFRQWVGTWSQGAGPPAPVVIAIDEAQRLRMDDLHPLSKLLQVVHDGETEMPLTLVLAGLGDTETQAQSMGLTRGLTVHPIGAFSREGQVDEVMELMHGFCTHFGLDPSSHESKLAALAAPCEGWPRHLHFACQALGRSVLAADGDLAVVDWERVELDSAESRRRYYQSQQSTIMEVADVLTACVMKDVNEDNMGYGAVIRLIERHVAQKEECVLPGGMGAEDYLQHLVHQGALHKSVDKTFHCPIPSFRTHLIAAGGLDPDTDPEEPEDDDGPSFPM